MASAVTVREELVSRNAGRPRKPRDGFRVMSGIFWIEFRGGRVPSSEAADWEHRRK
jgi:hypothetical protein